MNTNAPLAIIILAAGKGTRMKSDAPKVMHKLAGKPMINWLLDTCEALNPEKIITVIGPDMPDLAQAVAPHETAVQETRNGTGGALKCALPALGGFKGNVLVLMGDEPLVEYETLKALIAAGGLAVQGFETQTPHGLGRMAINKDGTLDAIIEERDCTQAQKQITLCNAGNYCVPAAQLKGWVEKIGNDNAQGEYYLTDLPQIAAQDGVKTQIVESKWQGPWGVNDRAQLAAHEAMLQNRLRENAMKEGVSMQDPSTVYLWHDTKIARGTTLEPNIVFGKKVSIEENVTIKAFSHIEDVHIESGCAVGPFARIRGGSVLCENTKIGNFVELKNAYLSEGVKANHLSYLGDTKIGENSNIGAGTITCNYNGFEKNRTEIGQNVFIGSNSSLVAPITIGDGALVAAGSTITEDVAKDDLAMTRASRETKTGWAAKYRKLKAAAKAKKSLAALLFAALLGAAPAHAQEPECVGFAKTLGALEAAVQSKPSQEQQALIALQNVFPRAQAFSETRKTDQTRARNIAQNTVMRDTNKRK